MQWFILVYESISQITTQMCHPHVAKARREYIKETYGHEPVKVTKTNTIFVDLGGALFAQSPKVKIGISKSRFLSCWEHQISGVASKIRLAPKIQISGKSYRRLGSFPNQLIFLSERDCKTVLATMDNKENVDAEVDYRKRLQEVFEKAQGLPAGSLTPPRPTVQA